MNDMKTAPAKKTMVKPSSLTRKIEELRRSEERYHNMITEVKDYAIFLLDTEGNIQSWNKGAERIKGYKEREILGKNFRIFYTPEQLEQKIPEKLLGKAIKEGSATHEGWRVRKDGTRFWGSVTITSLHDKKKRIIGFSKVTRDLTERKNAEDALSELAKELALKNKELEQKNIILERTNAELSSFNYVASHDLQEPLRKIQVLVSKTVDEEKEDIPEDKKTNLKRIQVSAERMQQLIKDLIAYSQSNAGDKKFQYTDLNSILEDVKSELSSAIAEHHADIHSIKLEKLDVIPFQIRQLFFNMISNALKFSIAEKPTIISIRAATVNGNTLRISAAKNKEFYKICFIDNGIGFDPKYKKQIFELFQRLHTKDQYPGTGLGLAICKKIAENHGGFITAESKEGKGAIFTVYLQKHPQSISAV
jgi:PAS domain S-box-containing protein